MVRRFLKTALIALAAVITAASMADAAPKRVVRHRTRHSTRVSSGSAAASRKKTVQKTVHRRVRRSAAKRKPTASTKPH